MPDNYFRSEGVAFFFVCTESEVRNTDPKPYKQQQVS
jgi:hypothetical protein